jgi:hypothetical protein
MRLNTQKMKKYRYLIKDQKGDTIETFRTKFSARMFLKRFRRDNPEQEGCYIETE